MPSTASSGNRADLVHVHGPAACVGDDETRGLALGDGPGGQGPVDRLLLPGRAGDGQRRLNDRLPRLLLARWKRAPSSTARPNGQGDLPGLAPARGSTGSACSPGRGRRAGRRAG